MNEELAFQEASRCLNCQNPTCMNGCPIQMEIPKFIKYIKEKNYAKAKRIIMQKSYLGSICGRVCPHDKQCEGSCIRGIKGESVKIGILEAFVSDKEIVPEKKEQDRKLKVAVVGSGPAGLTCAARLREKGIAVTIFEKEAQLGGILTYGIPEYRLSKEIVKHTISSIIDMGITVEKEMCFGKDFTLENLWEKGFQAVFLAIGAEYSKMLDIEGNDLNGVYGANSFLRNTATVQKEKVVVIGGGNVAMDAAQVARNNGADVTVIYRRKKEDMPANKKEIEEAMDSGVRFIFEDIVEKIIGDKKVHTVLLASGKEIDTDKVIVAIGSLPNTDYLQGIKRNEKGLVEINELGETNIPRVFAGGDLVQSKATVCMAIKSRKYSCRKHRRDIKEGGIIKLLDFKVT